ncbi:unnamed protein product [Soboliphyme baturini]|uniref:Solute carrier family 12 member 9 n=1 Tax=Soboliphyme baturini TaxID=241478 RepID=A0A183IKL4_9BILA|nr:unnamed protein product [Soboliphyme baturini]
MKDFQMKAEEKDERKDDTKKMKPPQKFGWIEGVLVRSAMSIFGVIFYLRLTWVTGQAGILLASGIVIVSSIIALFTALSLCAICSNGRIKGGGPYYIISRSLGPEFGGSIGIIFSTANAVAVGITISGFAETLNEVLKSYGVVFIDGGINSVRVLSWITEVVLFIIVITGVNFESKTQLVLMTVAVASVANYYIGSVLKPTDSQKARGMTGYKMSTFSDNMLPNFRGESLSTIFSIYFPAITGFLAGANMSAGSTVLRDASGSIEDIVFGNLSACNESCKYGLLNSYQVIEMEGGWGPLITLGIFAASLSSALAAMVSAPQIFDAVAKDKIFPYLEVLTSVPSGKGKNHPKKALFLTFCIAALIIAIGEINSIAPIITNFYMASYALINYACFDASFAQSPGFRPAFRHYNKWISLLGALICIVLMFYINWWAALMTTTFILLMYVYLVRRKPDVNWGTSSQANMYRSALQKILKLQNMPHHVKTYRPQFLVLTGSPVRRPALVDFVSNITKDSCLMICGHVVPGTVTERLIAAVDNFTQHMFKWLKRRRVYAFYRAVISSTLLEGAQSLLQLSGMSNLMPNILFIGYKNNWEECTLKEIYDYFQLIHLGFDFDKGVCILRLPQGFDISQLIDETRKTEMLHQTSDDGQNVWTAQSDRNLRKTSIQSAVSSDTDVFPNDLEYKNRCKFLSQNSEFDASSLDVNFSESIIDVINGKSIAPRTHPAVKSLRCDPGYESSIDEESIRDLQFEIVTSNVHKALGPRKKSTVLNRIKWKKKSTGASTQFDVFKTKIKKAVIDVWWLYDDGGLTVLISHLLTLNKSYLQGSKLRIFTITNCESKIEEEKQKLAEMLSKFRIEFSEVCVLPNLNTPPDSSVQEEFTKFIEKFLVPTVSTMDPSEPAFSVYTDETELTNMKQRVKFHTLRYLRIRHLLLDKSKTANLIVLTFPIPRKRGISASLYLTWLEMLTKDLPPILLVRGNQKAVLTFYS